MSADKAEEIANWLLTGEVEEIDLFEAAELIRQQAEQINNLQQWQRRQLDVIESLKAKTLLTDEEAFSAFADEAMKDGSYDWKAGVRAILRKAQEK